MRPPGAGGPPGCRRSPPIQWPVPARGTRSPRVVELPQVKPPTEPRRNKMKRCVLVVAALSAGLGGDSRIARGAQTSNVLFIAIDDLNHWVGHLGRHPQTKTPDIDRLAKQGVTFTRAY